MRSKCMIGCSSSLIPKYRNLNEIDNVDLYTLQHAPLPPVQINEARPVCSETNEKAEAYRFCVSVSI